ncbi:hypothetical protein [Roseobacter sp. HKCCA0434]|uniref:hypothetical protein n=1 Tax=Roseobacter sp. HKCCA0434 TaxID=3079297 RepID=UPI002905C6EC|nr:hypothetical protein [Roseobacter sp. HKCCA0434]
MSEFEDKMSLARAGAPDPTGGHGEDGMLPSFLQKTETGIRCVECGAEAHDIGELVHEEGCPHKA